MNYGLLAAAGCAATTIAAAAWADTTMVNCHGYVIGLSDKIAIEAQVRAGTMREFEQLVCDRSAEAAKLTGGAQVIPVFVEELGVSTRVVIFPNRDDD